MPINRRHIILLCGALLLLASGCRSRRESAQPAPVPSVAEEIIEPTKVPQYRTANFTCSLQGTQANGQLRMQTDSLIWASATKIIELGRAELTHDSVLIYSRVVNRCYRGSYEDIYRRFHYRTSFDEVQAILTAPDADRQIAALLKQLRIDGSVRLGPWKTAETLTFPFNIPANARPL